MRRLNLVWVITAGEQQLCEWQTMSAVTESAVKPSPLAYRKPRNAYFEWT